MSNGIAGRGWSGMMRTRRSALLLLFSGLLVGLVAAAHGTMIIVGSRRTDWGAHRIFTSGLPVSIGCGTDTNGNPSDNSQCGVSGLNPYTGENATDLTSWCGGKVPGKWNAISS